MLYNSHLLCTNFLKFVDLPYIKKGFFELVDYTEKRELFDMSSCKYKNSYGDYDNGTRQKEMEPDIKLKETFSLKTAGIFLVVAAYSIITQENPAQYYPDYIFFKKCTFAPV